MVSGEVAKLYHFTCEDHGAVGIGPRGVLQPNPNPGWQQVGGFALPVVWLTDLPFPDADELGLEQKSSLVRCDRMAVRYIVGDVSSAMRWPAWADWFGVDRELRALLEFGPARRPDRWWVSTVPIGARIG